MSSLAKRTYVISDLHLGGVYPDAEAAAKGDRGFRICTNVPGLVRFVDALTARPRGGDGSPAIELIINGDLVDFLAESNSDGKGWSAFTHEPQEAVRKFEAIVERDRTFFDALARFLARGHRLVILLGNHDIELWLPPVRDALARAVGAHAGSDYVLVPGPEAYLVGDALIEHGNRYDRFNIVDHEKLSRASALQSRSQPTAPTVFDPPPGSRMVAEVINPIKTRFKFVDLLKPETGAVVPLLLTLAPSYRDVLGRVALIAAQARDAVKIAMGQETDRKHGSDISAMPTAGMGDMGSIGGDMGGMGGGFGSDISAPTTTDPAQAALDALLTETLAQDAGAVKTLVQAEAATPAIGSDISTFGDFVDRSVGMMKLLFADSDDDFSTRLDALFAAFKSLRDDRTFDETTETAKEYLDAATALARNGVKHVVFGHTHMPKRISLPSGGFYLNSGTWADVMAIPDGLLDGDRAQVLPRLKEFVQHLLTGDLTRYVPTRPTYVRLDVGPDAVVRDAALCRFTDDVAAEAV
ncbi:MAG: metallophosphoesterase [Gemmatimonadetes bacterium]|nr:metallophosphoesterase [Gemmatimonadota bacterium]